MKELRIEELEHPWVGRGGMKLAHALREFGISVEGKICADIGASTGGFTDVMLKNGAKKVYACATHGIFSLLAIERIEASALDSVVVTDTVPIDSLYRPDKMTVLPISGLLAQTIMNVFSDDSVSAIFGGDTQLF